MTVSGPASGTFRGSIFPDNMAVKGRIKDGTYPLYLGLHRRSWKDDDGNTHFHTPTQADLCVRENGFRAALIVNNDASVPVNSESSTKTTSSSIHVHNGFQSQSYSDGCQTLHPSDWASFIQIFLDAYPTLAEWTVTSKYVGKQIGNLVVRT